MSGYFKAVPPSGITRGTLDWNVPSGTVVRCDHNVDTYDVVHGETRVCPAGEGDGLTIAKTWHGASLAGFPTMRCCTVTVDPDDILAEDDHKLRVRAVIVGAWFDATKLLREGWGHGANLYMANLNGADLYGANLYGANLYMANLYGANLVRANLVRANLVRADLYGANLVRADLYGANLGGANLCGVNLDRANLYGANLGGADLYGANLGGAYLGDWERGPDGYARRAT